MYARSAQLIRYLSEHTELTIFFLGPQDISDIPKIKRFSNIHNFIWLYPDKQMSTHDYFVSLQEHLIENAFDSCIFCRWDSVIYREAAHGTIKTFLDVDDIPSESLSSSQRVKNIDLEFLRLSEQQEFIAYEGFDFLIVIQQEHYAAFKKRFPDTSIILASHAVSFTPCLIQPKATNIGYIASNWETNIDALHWFLECIWPPIKETKVTLNIYGGVGTDFSKSPREQVKVHLHLRDLAEAYRINDIFINPVRYGSGLKIKTVEALAHGRPLVTTSEGARGLTHLEDHALLIADREEDFLSKLKMLVDSFELRKTLGRNAYHYAQENFTPDRCYGALLEAINAGK